MKPEHWIPPLFPRRPRGEPFEGMDHAGMPPADSTVPANLARIEQNALRRLTPPRHRWPDVFAFDKRAAELEQHQGRVTAEIAEVSEQLRHIQQMDAESLAGWTLDGQKSPRPESEKPGLERRLEELRRDHDGLTVAISRVLDGKATFVERHRARLVKQADQETQAAHKRVLGLIDQLAEARTDLAEYRATSVWAAVFPDQQAGRTPPVQLLAGGLVKPGRDAGLNHQVEAGRILDLLRADADWLRDAATAEQRGLIEGRDQPQAQDSAVWLGTDKGQERERRQKQAALRRHRELWGRDPA